MSENLGTRLLQICLAAARHHRSIFTSLSNCPRSYAVEKKGIPSTTWLWLIYDCLAKKIVKNFEISHRGLELRPPSIRSSLSTEGRKFAGTSRVPSLQLNACHQLCVRYLHFKQAPFRPVSLRRHSASLLLEDVTGQARPADAWHSCNLIYRHSFLKAHWERYLSQIVVSDRGRGRDLGLGSSPRRSAFHTHVRPAGNSEKQTNGFRWLPDSLSNVGCCRCSCCSSRMP